MTKKVKGERPLAIIECFQDIPCNPCVTACPRNAISMTDLCSPPVLDSSLCIGCGLCVACCPGQAIYMQISDYDEKHATITFPWEYERLPQVGSVVSATDHSGQVKCEAEVLFVTRPEIHNMTALVTLLIPKELKDEIRFMVREGDEK